MALHDDLLQQARDLAHKNFPDVTEADLRRAVSSAYYALFHLLISEACANWTHSSSRKHLARMFEHSYMRKVSDRVADPKRTAYANENPVVVQKLRDLAAIFSDLQARRHEADYDIARTWSFSQAMEEIDSATGAFALWNEIRSEPIAQDYLVFLLIKPRD
jgi:uncharacterized protein (UPF0332 family)